MKTLVEEPQIAGRTRPATEHKEREIRTDPAQTDGQRSKKKSSRWDCVFS
jgi:hypothetical protein